MAVLLDGQALPGLDHRVTIAEQIERKDLSGETSSAASAHGGWKPLRVTMVTSILRDDPWAMALLREQFDATDPAWKPAFYKLTGSDTFEALTIRKVRFADGLHIEEGGEERTWRVTFTLEEVDAAPERGEQHEASAEAETAGSPAADVAQTVNEAIAAVTQGDAAGSKVALERLLAFLDGLAGKYHYGASGQPMMFAQRIEIDGENAPLASAGVRLVLNAVGLGRFKVRGDRRSSERRPARYFLESPLHAASQCA